MSKRFGGVRALHDVDLDLREGEWHVLAGENGSGKSTLGKILCGSVLPDAGELVVDGRRVAIVSPIAALRLGIVAVTQELTLAPTLTVTENVLLGRLPRRGPIVQWATARRRARVALDELGVNVDERASIGGLGIELRQEVEIARALATPARLIMLDEATSSLSDQATARVLEAVDRRRRGGAAILFVSHRMREIYTHGQRATILRDGRVVGTVPLPSTPEAELIRMMVGRDLGDIYPSRQAAASSQALLEVSELSTEDGSVKRVSLNVAGGEILGVAGLVGCGKNELGLALAGATRYAGVIKVGGQSLKLRSPRHAISAGIAFIPEDRRGSALFTTRTVSQNLSIGWSRRLTRAGFILPSVERRMVTDALSRFGVRSSGPAQPILHLSGGNQQKVVLARWLATSPRVLVLSEPTRGVDIGAKAELYRMIRDVAHDVAVVVISSEMPELLGLCDRIVVMQHGRVTGELTSEEATEERIAHLALSATQMSTQGRPIDG